MSTSKETPDYLARAEQFTKDSDRLSDMHKLYKAHPLTVASLILSSLHPRGTLYKEGGDTIVIGRRKQTAPVFHAARDIVGLEDKLNFYFTMPRWSFTNIKSQKRARWIFPSIHGVQGLKVNLCFVLQPGYWGNADETDEILNRIRCAQAMFKEPRTVAFPPF